MSTPKISFKMSGTDGEGVSGDVAVHDIVSAPGKERERDPIYGGELGNINAMEVDSPAGGPFCCFDL
jgi:SWI/SNF related-matrix-associated actin-dependent regulator of chromatin subfamily C